jgi:L-amino acid N-acyltransferase YncA
MLPDEYQKRRSLPRHLQPPGEPAAVFSYEIRDATDDDVPDILALYRHYVRNSVVTLDEKAPSITAFSSRFRHLQKLGYPFRVAVSPQGTLLGYAYVFPFREKAGFRKTVESSIYLGPAALGRGLGSALLGDLIERCKEAELSEMIAVIADSGAEASMALHHKYGFVESGRMGKVGFKFGRWIGIVMMQKSLRR